MDLSKIKNDLQQVLQLVEDWNENGVNELERDLALERLREIYAKVRFGTAPQPANIADMEENVPSTETLDKLAEPVQNAEDAENLQSPMEVTAPIGVAISLDDVFEGFVPEEFVPEQSFEPVAEESELEQAFDENVEPEPEVEQTIVEPKGEELVAAEDDTTEVAEPELTEDAESSESVTPEQEEAEILPEPEVVAGESPEEEPTTTPVTETEEVANEEPAPATIAEQPSLFGDDVFLSASRPSRRTRMMSLYDDEQTVTVHIASKVKTEQPKVVAEPEAVTLPEPQPTTTIVENQPARHAEDVEILEDEEFVEVDVETQPAQISEPVAENTMPMEDEPQQVTEEPVVTSSTPYIEPQIEVTVAKPAASAVPESEQPVLGEVLKSDVQTIADTIKPKDTAAEKIAKGAVNDIGKAVGINDRFLLIRDLFYGDSDAYERTVEQLNNFDNLEDCMIYIIENFDWNPNSDGAKLMMELIERKYNN